MYRTLYGFILLLLLSASALAADKVLLQLKWEHEFQFAGYYAANWQGYYLAKPMSESDLKLFISSHLN